MNALVRYAASLIDSIALTRPTGAAFIWPHDVPDVPTYSDAERSEAAPTPARCRTRLPYVAPVVTVLDHDRDACD